MARSTARRSKRARKKQQLATASKRSSAQLSEREGAGCAAQSSTPPSWSSRPSAHAAAARAARASTAAPPPAQSSAMISATSSKSPWRSITRWIRTKLREKNARPANNQLDSEQLRRKWVSAVYLTALMAVSAGAAFCMYLLVSTKTELQIKAGAAALLAYIMRRFVVFLTRITL